MNEIAIRTELPPTDHEMMVYQTMAKSAVESKMYKGIGDQSGIMMIMLAARELGIPPMQALNGGLNIIQGKVEISARMMNALIRKAGHIVKIKESTETNCILEGRRNDTNEAQEASFSFAEAQKAGLVKPGGGWFKWPKDMLFARALSRLSRQLFPDVIGIGYVEGEIKAIQIDSVQPEPILKEINHKDPETWATGAEIGELFKPIPADQVDLFTDYIEVVMKHFGWTKKQCVEKFLEEKDLLSKFEAWKEKQKKEKNEENINDTIIIV